MKTKSFRLLTVLLTAVMLVALSLNVMAAKSNAVTKDGLTAQLFTDKDAYKAGESVKASVQVDNHTGREVFIFAGINAPEGVKLAGDTTAFDTRLQDGETWTTPGGITLSAADVAVGAAATGDNMQVGLWIVLTILAVCGIVALFVYGKNKKTWLSIMLCMAMVAGMAVAAVPARAADMNGDIELSCTIQVDGKAVPVSATVSYVIYDDAAEEANEPTATVAPTEAPEVTEAPVATEAPEATEAPAETDGPAVTMAPTEAPTTAPTEEPVETEAPEITEPPVETEAPATEPPAESETPATEAPAPTMTPVVTNWYDSELLMTAEEQVTLNNIMSDVLAMHKGSLKAYKNNELVALTLAPVEIDMVMYVPLAATAELLGVGEQIQGLTKDSEGVTEVDGELYITAAKMAEIANKPYFVHYGLVVFGKDSTAFDAASSRVQNEVLGMVRYDRTSGWEIYLDLTSNFEEKEHPRLYATADDFARIKGLIQTDEFVAKCFAYLQKTADDLLSTEPYEWEISSTRLVNAAEAGVRIEKLAFVYQITGEAKYAERAWKEMEKLCSFESWNPDHFLDVGGVMRGMAKGFDWLYNWMSDEQRELVKTKILEYGIKECYLTYIGNPSPGGATGHWWLDDEFNWSPNINGACLEGLVAIYDEEFTNNELEEMIIPSFEMALRALERHFNEWDPDGGWQEGPDYSAETLTLDAYIMSLLESAMGNDYGFIDTTGVASGAYYQLYLHGPAGDFNYSDAWAKTVTDFDYEFYFAKLFEDKSLGYERKSTLEVGNKYNCEPLELIWYDPQWIGDRIEELDLDKYFRKSEVVTMRSDWSEDGIFAGFLSGNNAAAHSHLDTGTYVLDWAGTRWVTDLGADALAYTEVGKLGNVFYRFRAEGHNTLVIDDLRYTYSDDGDDAEPIVLKSFDFNDVTSGLVSNSTSGTQSNGKGDLLGTGNTETIGDSTLTAVTVARGEDTDNVAIELKNPDGSGDKGRIQINLTEYPDAKVDVNYSICVTSALSADNDLFPQIIDSETGTNQTKVCPVKFTTGGKIQYLDGTTYVDAQDYTVGKGDWYDISIKMDIANHTYDLYIDGSVVKEGLALTEDLIDIKYINYQLSYKAGTVLFDDLSVEIPAEKMTVLKNFDFNDVTLGLVCDKDIYTTNTNALGTGVAQSVNASTLTAVTAAKGEDTDNVAIELKNPAASDKGRIQINLTTPYPDAKVEVNYNIRVDSALSGDNDMFPQILDEDSTDVRPIKFTTTGKIQCLDGSTYVDVQDYTVGKGDWYDISIKMNIANHTYDLYINGAAVKEGLTLPEAFTNIKYINYQLSYKAGTVLFDDLSIEIPVASEETVIPVGARGDDQVDASSCVINRYESKDKGALAITDMTAAYEPWATSVQRGVMLTNNRSAFIVRDEATLKAKSDVYWFAHTLKENAITINTDGKSVIMTDPQGNRMWVGILSGDGVFTVRDCKPMEGSPNPEGQASNEAYQKLTILFEGVTEMNVTVAYIPLGRDTSIVAPESIPTVPATLNEWNIPDGELPSVDTLTLGGKEITGFEPTKTVYTVTVRDDEVVNGNMPTVVATKGGVNLEVTQATTDSPVAYFTVTEGDSSTKFTINFIVRTVLRREVQGYMITEDDITVDAIDQEAHVPKNVLDGNLDTRFTALGLARWMILDFGQVRDFTKLDIAMYDSTADRGRNYKFEIHVSKDGFTYDKVGSYVDHDVYNADGTHAGPVTYDFGGTYQARFIKLVLNTWTDDGTPHWNCIAEIQ